MAKAFKSNDLKAFIFCVNEVAQSSNQFSFDLGRLLFSKDI